LRYFERDNEKSYLKIEGDLLADSRSNQNKFKSADTNDDGYEHPKELVKPASDFFEKHFCWKAGEYSMSINVVTDCKSATVTKKYRFTIFESHEETLTSIKEYFKYGGGIYWNPQIKTNAILEITEI